MFLISIGTDRQIFEEGSSVRDRIVSYAAFFEEFKMVVFAKKSGDYHRVFLNDVVEIIPTQSVSRWMYIRDALRIVKQEIRTRGTHDHMVISCQDPFETGLVGYMVSKRSGIPLHIQIHTDIGSPFFKKSSVLNRARLLIARFVLKQAGSVRVVSPTIKSYLIKTYGIPGDKITILPVVTNFHPMDRREQNEQYVLMVSRLEKEKQVDRAIDIFRRVLVSKPHFILKIAGSGREETRLKQITKSLGIERNVHFLGNVKNVAPLYAHASCLLHTSCYEGFGLVLFEAMQAGCPIVSTDVGIAKDLKEKSYDITICEIEHADEMSHAVEFYSEEFKKSRPVQLNFVPVNKDMYDKQYVQSIYQAGSAKLI